MKPISVEEAMAQSLAKITSVTPEVMKFVNEQIVHANFLDQFDTEDGRKYPAWLKSQMSIEDFFE
jgi:hypothetical protein